MRHTSRTLALALVALFGIAGTVWATGDDEDGDGLPDEDEVAYGTEVYDSDSDHDQRSDFQELVEDGSDPLLPDGDGDGILDRYDQYPTHNDQTSFAGGAPGPLNAPTTRTCLLSGQCAHDGVSVCVKSGGFATSFSIGGASGPQWRQRPG